VVWGKLLVRVKGKMFAVTPTAQVVVPSVTFSQILLTILDCSSVRLK
jgi:hypothetical protein